MAGDVYNSMPPVFPKFTKFNPHHINVINVGHMASDSVGMNILLDRFEENGVGILTTSGMTRVTKDYRKNFVAGKSELPSNFVR